VVGSVLEGLVDSDGVVAGQQGPAEEGEGSEPDGGPADGEQPAAAQLAADRPAQVSGRPHQATPGPTEPGGEPGGAPGRRQQRGPLWVEQASEVEAVERGDQDMAVWSGDPGQLHRRHTGAAADLQDPRSRGQPQLLDPGEGDLLAAAEDPGLQRPRRSGWPHSAWTADRASVGRTVLPLGTVAFPESGGR